MTLINQVSNHVAPYQNFTILTNGWEPQASTNSIKPMVNRKSLDPAVQIYDYVSERGFLNVLLGSDQYRPLNEYARDIKQSFVKRFTQLTELFSKSDVENTDITRDDEANRENTHIELIELELKKFESKDVGHHKSNKKHKNFCKIEDDIAYSWGPSYWAQSNFDREFHWTLHLTKETQKYAVTRSDRIACGCLEQALEDHLDYIKDVLSYPVNLYALVPNEYSLNRTFFLEGHEIYPNIDVKYKLDISFAPSATLDVYNRGYNLSQAYNVVFWETIPLDDHLSLESRFHECVYETYRNQNIKNVATLVMLAASCVGALFFYGYLFDEKRRKVKQDAKAITIEEC